MPLKQRRTTKRVGVVAARLFAVDPKGGNEGSEKPLVVPGQPMNAAQPSQNKCWERPCSLSESNPWVGLAGSQAGGFFNLRSPPRVEWRGRSGGCTIRRREEKNDESRR